MQQLRMRRTFAVPVAKLYAAWTRPAAMRRWYAPGNMTVAEAVSDLKVGGKWRVVMQDPDGSKHIVGGEYLTIVKNEVVEFTWQWRNSPAATRVKLAFKSTGANSSALVLTHAGFTDAEVCERHKKGWRGCLAKLTAMTA